MPSSHCRHVRDGLVRVGSVNRVGDKSRLSATENFETVLSSLEMRRGLLKTLLDLSSVPFKTRQSTVLSCPCQWVK